MATLLTVVEGLNTGKLLWDSVGPWIQQMIENGKITNITITQADLEADSVNLGIDLDALHAEIAKAKAEGR